MLLEKVTVKTENGEFVIAPLQLITLRIGLNLEIKTEGKARFTQNETALESYKRLVADKAGFEIGEGQEGRYLAVWVVEDLLDQLGIEY